MQKGTFFSEGQYNNGGNQMIKIKKYILLTAIITFLLLPVVPMGMSAETEEQFIDLKVIDIYAWRQIWDQDKFNVRVRIKNVGNHHADSGFDVGLYMEIENLVGGYSQLGLIRTHEVTIDLGAGHWRDIYFWNIYWKSPSLGDYRMRFSSCVDIYDEVEESNENNNCLVDNVWWY